MNAFQPKSSPQNLDAYCDELSAALDKGLITKEQWYEGRKKATAIAYLSQDNPRAQSGYGGDEARWRYTRVLMILEAIHKDGSFLDVGCANGHLIECLQNWVEGSGLNVEERLSSWGYAPTGWLLKSQGEDIGLTRKMIWLDKE